MNIFLVMIRFCGYFWGVITKLDYNIKGSFLYILGSLLKFKVQNGG